LCIVVCTMCMMHLHFGSGECLDARHGWIVLKFCGGQGFDGVQLNWMVMCCIDGDIEVVTKFLGEGIVL
jgi:hypothetical protein